MTIDICPKCLETEALYPAKCNEKPETRINEPIGMYPCLYCGTMLIAGVEHPFLCERCINEGH